MFCKIIVFIVNELKLSIIKNENSKQMHTKKQKNTAAKRARTQANGVDIQPPTTDRLIY
jgi:hypothetical protein